jgi:hypothetical protein
MAALSSYSSIETALVVKLDLPEGVFVFSDYNTALEVDGYTAEGLGVFVGITNTTSELRVSNDTLTITLSGIPNAVLQSILAQKMKGSRLSVTRVFFNPVTKQLLDLSPNSSLLGRFYGVINNVAFEEEWDYASRTSRNTVSIICSSLVSVLERKYAGRRTNPDDQKTYFPTDLAFDRIPALVNSNFQFGAQQ